MNKKSNKDYPGYPHYPADEDITRASNNNGKLPINADNKTTQPFNDTVDDRDEDIKIVKGTDADVTKDDLRILETAEQNMDTPDARNLIGSSLDNTDLDGDPLNEDSSLIDDVSAADLDIPGASADDRDEAIGEEDEENNFYSLGGDNHENQEENKGD